ncbi:hypothetical protein AB0C34_17560 [Nocardia sp. NPDC049220]|uniref:hypothetical protein n=1 Tax=Nocardia sp. NPDC049220 TaxID=3155273 RepID=UPI0033EA3F32
MVYSEAARINVPADLERTDMSSNPGHSPNAPQLGAAERERLRHAHRILLSSPDADLQKRGGQAVADILRAEVPDLDDVTIGRVALAVGRYLGHLAASDNDRNMTIAGNQVIAAGLHLTEAEWNAEARP